MAAKRCGGTFERWEKSPGQPVCDIDLEVDSFLRAELQRLDPDTGWLSEETADGPERIACDRVWVVDPIDGTRDYLRERSGWCVSIALVQDGNPILGVLDAPARGEHWTAQQGCGARRNGVPLKVSGRNSFSGARVAADQVPAVDADLIPIGKPNSIALRIAMVAAGEADLVATLRWGFEWDVAAAALIASEAGAAVTDALGQPLAFNTVAAQAFGVLATTPAIHAAAVERLRERALRLAAGPPN